MEEIVLVDLAVNSACAIRAIYFLGIFLAASIATAILAWLSFGSFSIVKSLSTIYLDFLQDSKSNDR